MPGFQYIHRLEVKDRYQGIPTDVVEMLSHPQEGEKQDINCITKEEIIEIEKCHTVVPRRRVNIRPGKKMVVLCIDPNSDSDIVIEEGETDFKTWCLIVKEEKKDHESGEEGDDEQSEQPMEATAEQESALQATEQKTDVDETISSTLTQDFDRDLVEKEFINLAQNYQHISDSFAKLINEVPHMKKWQLATHIANTPVLPLLKVMTEEKVSSMYGQRYTASKASSTTVTEEMDLKVYRTMDEEKVQSVWNTTQGQLDMLLLLAMGDCVANNKLQAEVAKKYGILKSRIQRTMFGKKEHKKSGNQYWQRKRRGEPQRKGVYQRRKQEVSPRLQRWKLSRPQSQRRQEPRKSNEVQWQWWATRCETVKCHDIKPKTSSPYQDHPNPPIRKYILRKALKN